MINNLKELNVLYIDDDKVACKHMEATLSYFFKEVFIEHNGLNALDIYQKESIHLLLVDYDMPIMNGLSFLQEIRKINNTIPAVIISSYNDKEKLLKAMKLNLVAYLTKPLEFSDLKDVLEECSLWMDKHGLLKVSISENCVYDYSTKTIRTNDDVISLTAYEYRIFEFLLTNKNKVVTFEEIFYVLDNEDANKKSLTSLVYKINKKLSSPVIKNIKDVGYTMVRMK
ncbi:response regulator [Poseidonibacter lekithochrous]|uniref:response regulator transcription factor n=1 Tax=Poseidonibacter TaxID=2321187 RepID=UPI001C0973D3|nr:MULTISPECIES: response regulator [Poseidonibacter]MBU3014729.1 response regulator [Poseidonibacter lekithochrous]MDO6828027.1 response regulator [Poseidonibacter sp. 1_MG-2023]